MKTLALLILGAIVLGLLSRRVVRGDSRLAGAIRLATRLVTNLGVALIAGWTGVQAAQQDEPLLLALAGLCGLVTVGAIFISGLFVWDFLRISYDERRWPRTTDPRREQS